MKTLNSLIHIFARFMPYFLDLVGPFLIGLAIGILSCVITFLYFQKKHKQKLNDWRIKLAADLHDDVGSTLCALAMQAEILEKKVGAPNKESANKIAKMSRLAMGQMRDTVWAIDARKNTWASLVDRLREHADYVLLPKGIQFDLQINGINPEQPIDPAIRQNLYLIGKEAITNVIQHSNATKVSLKLNQSQTGFNMIIEDNGEQLEKWPGKSKGFGLSNMLLRAKSIDGHLKVTSNQGFGIRLVAPWLIGQSHHS